MVKDEKKLKYQAVRSLFVNGGIKRMKDIEKLYPTMISKDLKINHSRYIQKLYKPDLFTIQQIQKLAALLEIDPILIINIILKQLNILDKGKRR
jgi:hypothetical protein